MINYKQLYKDEVIVTIACNDDTSIYDRNLTSNIKFYAVGSKTSNDLSLVSQVKNIDIWCVKPDAILNLTGSEPCKISDDDGNLLSMNFSGYHSSHLTNFRQHTTQEYLRFTNADSNIHINNYNSNGLTLDINNLDDKSNVSEFNATVTVPSDVKCNYTTGTHKFIKNQTVNILFDGNIRKGDTITIKRNGRNDLNTEIKFNTDLAFTNLGMNNVNNMEIIYKHNTEETPTSPKTQTVNFISSDEGIKWINNTMVDNGINFNNSIIIQKGYELRRPLKVECTDNQDQTTTLTYGNDQTINYDGYDKNTWNLTINTGYKKINILAGQTKYKQYNLIPTLQNAKVIIPEASIDKYRKTVYYVDPKHTIITLQANAGYTFENNGTLTYNINDLEDQKEYTINATHTNTVTFTLPSNVKWEYQDAFRLTMGAVKAEIVEATGGFTNIYKADYTNLLKFSNEVIMKTVGGSSGNLQSYDVTPYINNLVLVPFNVPSGEKSNIVAGNEIFKTQLSTVDNNYLTINLGNITVPETYKNGYDYYNVKTRLMLPYTNMIELDPVHVINQTISIKYIVNVVNGDTTINLLNGDDLFYSEQVNLASEVPFITNARKGTQYAVINRLKTVFKNSIKQAYIIIEQPTPILNSDYYPTNEKGTLKGYNGNVKCTLLNNMSININDLNTLQNLLKNGVNIK